MGTRKLFYEDCHRETFSATVISCEKANNGYAVVLDATAFYPEGGGQACDVGMLENVQVLDVQEAGDEIVHLCDGALAPGQQVTGTIDFSRRFDLMQQHTGEHILSGLIHKRFGLHNMGFHVGAQCMEVDFDGVISPEELAQLAQLNRLVDEVFSEQSCFRLQDLAVNGSDLIAAGIAPGPGLGKLLQMLLEQVQDERLPNTKQALLDACKEVSL